MSRHYDEANRLLESTVTSPHSSVTVALAHVAQAHATLALVEVMSDLYNLLHHHLDGST